MWATLWELHLSESCSNRNSSIIETFELPRCKKSSLYICSSWNFKHQGLHCNLPNTMFLSVMTPKNYPVNLSNVNFTDSGYQNSIKFLQVNSFCRKILHQIDVSVSRNCTQLRSSSGTSGTASPLQPRTAIHTDHERTEGPEWWFWTVSQVKLCWNQLCHKTRVVRQRWDQCRQNKLWFWKPDLVNPGGDTKEVGLPPRCPRLHLFLAMITQPWEGTN